MDEGMSNPSDSTFLPDGRQALTIATLTGSDGELFYFINHSNPFSSTKVSFGGETPL